jgi:hypothetical protein
MHSSGVKFTPDITYRSYSPLNTRFYAFPNHPPLTSSSFIIGRIILYKSWMDIAESGCASQAVASF